MSIKITEGMEFRAIEALPVDGKPAWYGQYRMNARDPWHTAQSQYGMIIYLTPEQARAGAAYASNHPWWK